MRRPSPSRTRTGNSDSCSTPAISPTNRSTRSRSDGLSRSTRGLPLRQKDTPNGQLTAKPAHPTLAAPAADRKRRIRVMEVRKFSRLVALLFSLLAVGLLSPPVFADGTTVGIPGGGRGGSVSVPGGGPLRLAPGWAMGPRGNPQTFPQAGTGIISVNGQAVERRQVGVLQLH